MVKTVVDVVREIRVSSPALGERIKAARLASGVSVQALATQAGISSAYWYQIENGARAVISEPILRGIEHALGLNFGVHFDD